MARVWEFAHCSRSFCNDRCTVSADEISMAGECLNTADRSHGHLTNLDKSLANTTKALQSLRAA